VDKAIGTILGGLIIILIIIAFFTTFIFVSNQSMNIFLSQIKKISTEIKRKLENLQILSSSNNLYLPSNKKEFSGLNPSGEIFTLYTPFDGKYYSISSTVTTKEINVTFTFYNLTYPSASSLDISLVFSYIFNTGVVSQIVYLWNWNTNSWDSQGGTFTVSPSDSGLFLFRIISVSTPSNYLHSNGTLRIQVYSTNPIEIFKAYFDYLSIKVFSPSNFITLYVLNNSESLVNVISIIVFNSTQYLQFNVNINIASNEIKLIKINAFIKDSSIKLITNEGNIFQSKIF